MGILDNEASVFASRFPQQSRLLNQPYAGYVMGKTEEGRPIVVNKEGGLSTERKSIIGMDGKHYVIPTMFGGKTVSVDEAADRVFDAGFRDPDTGRSIPGFSSVGEAAKEEERRNQRLRNDRNISAAFEEFWRLKNR